VDCIITAQVASREIWTCRVSALTGHRLLEGGTLLESSVTQGCHRGLDRKREHSQLCRTLGRVSPLLGRCIDTAAGKNAGKNSMAYQPLLFAGYFPSSVFVFVLF
jgi:hypothetical protein